MWDANPDTLIASSIALAAGRARKADGGYIVSGRWPFSSGVDNSDWNMLAATIYGDDGKPADSRLCLVPKSDYQIIDTWHAMGMSATGSKDVAATDIFVPERRALALSQCRGGFDHPGAKINRDPLYGIPIVAASSHPLAPAAVGAAEGAYEMFLASMAKRAGTYTGAKVSDFQAVQIKVARARVLIDSARDLLRQSAIALQDHAARGEVPEFSAEAALARAIGLRGRSGARSGRDIMVLLRCARALHARSAATASARRDRHRAALLVQFRYRGRGFWIARVGRDLR